MAERSEEQILNRLLELENGGEADRRVRLEDESYISLIHDPQTGHGYVLKHPVDNTDGAEIPDGTEFYDYPTRGQAEQAFEALVSESAAAGTVEEEDSTEDEGDVETEGAEMRDMYSDEDTDPLIGAENLSEDDEEPPNTIDS